jgi:hypothetical protein
MSTENLSQESLDASAGGGESKQQPTIPTGYVDVTRIRERDLEYMDQQTADQVRLAQAAAREEKRKAKEEADKKAAAESAASAKRAKDAVEELVRQDSELSDEERPGGTEPREIEVKNVSAEHRAEAEQFAADMGAIAADVGIPAEEAQTLYDYAVDLGLTSTQGLNLNNQEECLQSLHTQYGPNVSAAIVRDAQAAVRRLGQNVAAYLNVTGLGNAPSVLLTLAEFHRGTTKLSKDAAMRELTKLRGSKEFQSGQRYAVDRGRLLSAIAHRGDRNELKAPNQVVPSARTQARSKIEARIKELRSHPAYFDRSHASHKEVVAQVSELYGQLGTGA